MTGARRWKYTYENIVYITDNTSTKEITSWVEAVDIPSAALSLDHMQENEAVKERLAKNPSWCTSHTVIVVDHSSSMNESDVSDFRSRAQAVFGMLALDFVAKQRLSGEATNTDVVSLLLMHDSVEVVFDREPMGLVLYNKFVDMHSMVRPRSHGNFLPSLTKAEELFREDDSSGSSALCLLFLSDGRPSDNATGVFNGTNMATEREISNRISRLAAKYRRRLTVSTVGFAGKKQNFSVLEAMAAAARDAGARGNFCRPALSSKSLGSAISQSVSLLTATRTKLTAFMGPPLSQTPTSLRHVEREPAGCSNQWVLGSTADQTGDGCTVITDSIKRFEFSPADIRGLEEHPWIEVNLFSDRADGIVIRQKPFGEGAERLVYGMQVRQSRWIISLCSLLFIFAYCIHS